MRLALCITLAGSLLAGASVTTAQESKQPFEDAFVHKMINDDFEAGLEGAKTYFDLENFIGKFERTTVSDVQKAYSKNEIKGNKLYKNKNLLISGKIDEISQDPFGTPYLTFKYKQFVFPRAYFSKSELDSLADLEKGQNVYAFCKIGEYVMNSIAFKDCLLANTVIRNKAEKPAYESIIKCLDSKCSDKKNLKMALFVGMLNDNTTAKEKDILLSDKASRKQFDAIIDRVKKLKNEALPARMIKAGWTKEEVISILDAN